MDAILFMIGSKSWTQFFFDSRATDGIRIQPLGIFSYLILNNESVNSGLVPSKFGFLMIILFVVAKIMFVRLNLDSIMTVRILS